MEEIHIGARIKEKAKEQRLGATEFGKFINTSKQNIYGIYKRKTIDTGLLVKISKALDYNFFLLFTTQEQEEVDLNEKLYMDIERMKTEIEDLKAKYKNFKKGKI